MRRPLKAARRVHGRGRASRANEEVKPERHGLTGDWIPLGFREPDYAAPLNAILVDEGLVGFPDYTRYVAMRIVDAFRRHQGEFSEGREWYAWFGEASYHPRGLLFSVGFSTNVPPAVLDWFERELRVVTGCETARSTVVPERGEGLTSIVYLGPEGLELLSTI